MRFKLIALHLFFSTLMGLVPIYAQDFSHPTEAEFSSPISKPLTQEASEDSAKRILGQTGVQTASTVTEGTRVQHEIRTTGPRKTRRNMLLEVPEIFAALAFLSSVVALYFYRARLRRNNVPERTPTDLSSEPKVAVEALLIPLLGVDVDAEICAEDEELIKSS